MPRTLPAVILLLLFGSLIGCSGDLSKSESGRKTASAAKTETPPGKSPKSAKQAKEFAHLFPAETIAYLRIDDVQRVKDELISPKHVKDAAKVQEQIAAMIQNGLLSLAADGKKFGISQTALARLILVDLNAIHVCVSRPGDEFIDLPWPESVVVLELRSAESLSALRRELQPNLKTESVDGTEIQVLPIEAFPPAAFWFLDDTTLVIGTQNSLTNAIRRQKLPVEKTLAGSLKYQTAVKQWGKSGELFLYVDYAGARPFAPQLPFSMVSHFAMSLGLDGGFSMRAYAADGKSFPPFLVRTPREKKFLSRIPEDAVFLLGTGTDAVHQSRRNFIDWVMQELGQDSKSATQLLPESMQKFAQSHLEKPNKIETETFNLLKVLWSGVLPVKSESAFFVAPDAKGRWGAAYLFDIENRKQADLLAAKLRGIGEQAKLTWQKTRQGECDIHYIDVAEAAVKAGQPVPPAVAKQTQLQVGYAECENLFLVGTVESIRYALKPTGETLVKTFPYENIDEKNAIMLTLQPGRILHRTFGVPELDDVLKRLASQIPKDSSYSVTLNFEPKQLTLRTNIPFISLFGWLLVEMTSDGPAGLRGVIHKSAK